MQKNCLFKNIVIFIVLCLIFRGSSGAYCSAYCSYYNLGAAYSPMCTDQTAVTCTKCDESLFTLNAGQCVPHGKFNETLQRTDLMPTITTLTDWSSVNNLYHINTVSGLYSTVEFYQDPSIPAGGDDLLYKIFTGLPAHFTVKLRFFVIRSASSTMQFSYYLDNHKFNFNYNQYPSNTTLGDIITTDKILHQNLNLTVGFQAKFAAGVTEYIGIKELLLFVSRCSLYCEFCSNSTNCVKCEISGFGDKTYLYKGQCYTECPQQTFAQDTTQTCQPCQAECQNCVGTSTNCTQCKFQGKHQTFLLNNSCFYSCPDGYFKDFDTNQCICPVNGYYINTTTNLCQPCASECNSCYGPTKNQCYNCSIGNFLIFGTQWCSTTCPSGQYGDELAKKCFRCSSTCSQCVNSSSQCTACFFRSSTRYLYDSKCLFQCPTGYEKNFALRKCLQCPPFYYSFNGQCLIECPQNYVANNETKSCLHITQTNFTLTPQTTGIQVLMKGKSVFFSVRFSQGLSQSSKSWLSSQGYYNTKLKINQHSILTSNIKLQSQKVYSFGFNLQQQLDESTIMTIDFGTRLKTQQNISYSRATAQFSLSSNPQMLAEYYKKSQTNYLNVMFIPALLIMLVLIAMRSKQTYEMLIETVRTYQLMGLAVFIAYPLQSPIFSLLQGLNYFNLQFFPNVYNWFVPTFKNTLNSHVQFAGFRFLYGDMDFIRMIGSILVFVAVWILFIIVLKIFFVKNNLILGWLLRIGMELIQIKILHSFWNSLIFTIINSSQNNIYILWLHLFSYIFMGFTIFRYYKIYQENGTISYPFLWRLLATLLLSVAVYQQMVLLIVLSLISVAFGFQQYRSQKRIIKSVQSFRFSMAFKLRALTLSFLPLLSILIISILVFYRQEMSVLACLVLIGVLGYFIVIMNVIVVILMRYYFKMRENRNVKIIITKNDGQKSKRIFQKQIIQEHAKYQTTPKQDLQTILSKDDNTIVTEKEVFIKDEFEADFHIAHKNTVPDIGNYMEDSHRQNQTAYEKSNYNQSTLGLMDSSLKNQLPSNQQGSRVKPLKRFSHNKNIQSWKNNQHQQESIFEDELIQRKFGMGHQTQAIRKSKTKLQPLQTVDIRKEDEAQFQQIQLTKRSNPQDKKSNKPMKSIKLLTEEGFTRFNTVDINQQLNKKDSPGVIYYEKEEQPRRKLQGVQELRLRSNVFLRDEQESP